MKEDEGYYPKKKKEDEDWRTNKSNDMRLTAAWYAGD